MNWRTALFWVNTVLFMAESLYELKNCALLGQYGTVHGGIFIWTEELRSSGSIRSELSTTLRWRSLSFGYWQISLRWILRDKWWTTKCMCSVSYRVFRDQNKIGKRYLKAAKEIGSSSWHSVENWLWTFRETDSEGNSVCILYIYCIYTGCFTTLGHNCRRWFPRSLWSKKFK